MQRWFGAALAIWLPGLAWAECTGGGCYDGLSVLIALFFLALAVIVGLGVAVIVLLLRKRWRAAKIIGAILAATTVCVWMFFI